LVDASGLIVRGAGGRQGMSKFIVTRLPYRPQDASISPYPTGIVRSIPSSGPSSDSGQQALVSGGDRSTNRTNRSAHSDCEAQGWVINNKGLVVLTATVLVSPHSWIPEASCQVKVRFRVRQ